MSGSLTLIGGRYQIHELIGAGAMGSVYRCVDRLTEQTVALKSVKLERAAGRGDARRLAITREFETLASLHHPRVIEVIDYGFDADDKPFFTMNYLENAHHIDAAARDLPLDARVHLIIQMLEALEYLHRREIIHHDLKPSNVLVDSEGGVKVLDFGVALLRQSQSKDSTSGTIGYAAPEFMQGARPSVCSDLYAVGVLAYEVVIGHHPFDLNNLRHLLYQIANETPDFSALSNPQLIDVLTKLMAKTPAERYQSARLAIRDLYEALGEPIPAEPTAIRESFLQAAQFVGREAEFSVLKDALAKAREGEGSAWLIGGESGVGKSRLLDELRTQALVEGALVLRGQGIAEGGLSFQLWRDAVRRLSLQTDLSDLAASILKPLVPDIGRLLGRDVRDLPSVDAQSLQLRLLSVIEAMFREQQQLIVVLLEDLQWAVDSLILLKRLNELANESNLLIIGTYRDDERPTLPDELPALHHLKLDRLAPASIEQLSASMLGDAGKASDLVDLLTRETEGNVFFIVEVMRVLAEDAGQLADIGQKSLPEHVFAGGMRTVIQRRLDTVPESARELMTVAAVDGRALDLGVLQVISPTTDLDDWLQQVATVIEVRDSRYRFAHDKLRETILANLPADQRRSIHQKVAQAIETAYTESPEQVTSLAYHWSHAQDAAKTIHYASLAGQQAMHSGSYREAIQFFEQAVALTDQVQLDTLALANLYYLLGHAYWGQTNSRKTYEAHRKALHLLGIDVPQTPRRLILGMLWPLANHLRRRMIGIHRPHAHNEASLLAAKALNEITVASYHDANFGLGLFSIANGMNVVEQAGNSLEALGLRVSFYGDIGFAFGDMGIHPAARSYFALAQKYLQRETDPEAAAALDYVYGGYLAAQGNWALCNQVMNESLQTTQKLGSWIHWIEAIGFQVPSLMFQGRFAESLATAENAIQIAARNGQTQSHGMLIVAKARLLLMQGKTAEASTEYFDNEAKIEAVKQVGAQINGQIGAQGFRIEFYRRTQNWDAALTSAEALNALIRDAQTVSLSFMLGADATASIALYLTLWEKRGDPSYGQTALTMLDVFHRKYTRQVAIGHPIEAMYRCWHAWLSRDEQQARKLGAQAIQAAQTYQMPYYEAAARYHLARFMPKDDPERASHLKLALQLFERIGAAYDADLIRQSTHIAAN